MNERDGNDSLEFYSGNGLFYILVLVCDDIFRTASNSSV